MEIISTVIKRKNKHLSDCKLHELATLTRVHKHQHLIRETVTTREEKEDDGDKVAEYRGNSAVGFRKRLQRNSTKMFKVVVQPPTDGVFFSGSEICGSVHITTATEKKFKYIHVSLTGRTQVWWIDSSSRKEYSAEKECVHETQILWTKEDSSDGLATFPAGSHTLPFLFNLPHNVPSSFESRMGWVRYELLGRVVTECMKQEHSVEIELPVMEVLDINHRPELLRPQNVQVQKRIWCPPCSLSNVAMAVDLNRTAFCVGEDIPLNVAMENGSKYDVIITSLLRQKVTYTSKKGKREYDKAAVVQVTSGRIPPRTSTIWPTNLRVPLSEATTQDYQPINITYRIKIVASIGWGQTLVARIPITIGNVPFRVSLVDKDIHNSRDQLLFGSHDSHNSFSSLDDRVSTQGYPVADSQLEHTMTSQQDSSTAAQSYFYDSQCTYSFRDYIDSGDLSHEDDDDDKICPGHHHGN